MRMVAVSGSPEIIWSKRVSKRSERRKAENEPEIVTWVSGPKGRNVTRDRLTLGCVKDAKIPYIWRSAGRNKNNSDEVDTRFHTLKGDESLGNSLGTNGRKRWALDR